MYLRSASLQSPEGQEELSGWSASLGGVLLTCLGELGDRRWEGWASGNFAEQEPQSSELSARTMTLVCDSQRQTGFPGGPGVRRRARGTAVECQGRRGGQAGRATLGVMAGRATLGVTGGGPR